LELFLEWKIPEMRGLPLASSSALHGRRGVDGRLPKCDCEEVGDVGE
jgi:hypothetical protein